MTRRCGFTRDESGQTLVIFAALFFWLARTYLTRAFRSSTMVAYARDA